MILPTLSDRDSVGENVLVKDGPFKSSFRANKLPHPISHLTQPAIVHILAVSLVFRQTQVEVHLALLVGLGA